MMGAKSMGRANAVRICEVLGIDPHTVRDVRLTMSVDEAAQAHITVFLSDKQLEAIFKDLEEPI
jgi:hypothetical protein